MRVTSSEGFLKLFFITFGLLLFSIIIIIFLSKRNRCLLTAETESNDISHNLSKSCLG